MPTTQPQSNLTAVESENPKKRDPAPRPDISHFDKLPDAAMISIKALATVVDKGISTVWRNCQQDPDFPRPIRLGPGCTRFKVGDIRAYLAVKASAPIKPKRARRTKGQGAA